MKVIFDTNATRDYIAKIHFTEIEEYAKLNAKKLNEKKIELLVSPIVIMELIYHLLDKKDKDYFVSYNAIKAFLLTMEYQYETKGYPMMAASECIIANDLFGVRIENREKMYSNLMSGASYIIHKDIDQINDFVNTDGKTVKEYIDDVENTFVIQTRKLIKIFNSMSINLNDTINSKHREYEYANYIIRTTYNLLITENKLPEIYANFKQDIIDNFDEINIIDLPMFIMKYQKYLHLMEKMRLDAEFIINKYPSFIALFEQLMTKISNNLSDQKIKNYIWDILLMFNVTNFTIQNELVAFVTSDKAMLEAASISDKKLSIMTFEEFKSRYL